MVGVEKEAKNTSTSPAQCQQISRTREGANIEKTPPPRVKNAFCCPTFAIRDKENDHDQVFHSVIEATNLPFYL